MDLVSIANFYILISFIDTFDISLMTAKNSHIVKTQVSRYIYSLLVLAETFY